jgi:hypothetical protein
MDIESNENIRETVRQGYTEIAQGKPGCCGSTSPDKLAQGIGYKTEELEVLPEGANMGLSCGNPTAIANLKQGQTVLAVIPPQLQISSRDKRFWIWAAEADSMFLSPPKKSARTAGL